MSHDPLTGLVILLHEAPIDALIGAVEVLVQEGITNLSLPWGYSEFTALQALYSSRARIGLHGAIDDFPDGVRLGASFLLPDTLNSEQAAAAADAGVACYGMAMTPSEIRAALELPVSGVQLFPADAVGPGMAERLEEIGLIPHVLPRGGVIAYAAKQWLRHGAPAVVVDRQLLGDALEGGDLAALRDRSRSFNP
ncbi:MAG: hypothetical protein Q4D79_07215 [Propionibacteriaceae bacterium]|nr:hypothetical protein [Propionibacteriaceae bacterium]